MALNAKTSTKISERCGYPAKNCAPTCPGAMGMTTEPSMGMSGFIDTMGRPRLAVSTVVSMNIKPVPMVSCGSMRLAEYSVAPVVVLNPAPMMRA